MATYFVYYGHLGGLYWSDDELDYDDLDCECGDGDDFVGTLNLDYEPSDEEMDALRRDSFSL